MNAVRGNLSYVLITPARNEEDNIDRTINCMLRQTALPQRWVIVSDGSTDRTDDIVRGFLPENPWIDFIRMPEHEDRQFAAKVNCFNAGYNKIKSLDFEIIGNLDADISFEHDYFEFLLSRFQKDRHIGVAGTPFVEEGRHYDYRFTNIDHVSGACQLFRRECYEAIGGYTPIRGGGVDWVAVTTARMVGWKTRTFLEKTCLHHRKIGTGNASGLMTFFRQGCKDYFLGNHPLWEMFRVLYQMKKRPFVLGGTFISVGFVVEGMKGVKRPISRDLLKFVHREQIQRLKKLFKIEGLFK